MALSTDRRVAMQGGNTPPPLPVAAAAVIHANALICVNTSGYAVPATTTADFLTMGVALTAADNTGGANGAISVAYQRRVSLWMKNLVGTPVLLAHVGQQALVHDDETVKAPGAGVAAGKILAVDATQGVLIEVQ
jgi:hypothetical protein